MKNLDTLFKAYDIRGRTPEELDVSTARDIGRALADFLPEGEVVVGHDMRTDSKDLAVALMDGLVAQGRKVLDIGQCSSDMIYYAVGALKLAGGAMITASHNAAGYNGVKLTGQGVSPIGADSGLDVIKSTIKNQTFKLANQIGSIEQKDLVADFVTHAVSVGRSNFGPIEQLRIGYDAGNGMSGIFVDQLRNLSSLTIEGLYLEPDGSFPNHHPNPMLAENLKDIIALQIKDQLDFSVAFDGDGDRAFFIDDHGQPVSGSLLAALLAAQTLARKPRARIIYSAVCSRIVPETIEALGGMAIESRVGHSFIKKLMHETGAVLGVEASGHYYYADNFHADSGLITLAAVAGIVSAHGALSALLNPFRKYFNSGELNFTISDAPALLRKLWDHFSDGAASELEGLTIRYPDWWFNVRASNTEPLVRLNIEANSQALLTEKLALLTTMLERATDKS